MSGGTPDNEEGTGKWAGETTVLAEACDMPSAGYVKWPPKDKKEKGNKLGRKTIPIHLLTAITPMIRRLYKLHKRLKFKKLQFREALKLVAEKHPEWGLNDEELQLHCS